MAVTPKSLQDSSTNVENTTAKSVGIEQVAVVITFRQTIEQFYHEHQPAKLKWSNFTESDVRRLVYYNIIEPADTNMGTQTVWTLVDWVQDLLEETDYNFNFSSKQIKEITRYADSITSFSNEFVARDTDLAGRSVGHLHEMGFITMVEDNRNKHTPTVWTTTDRIDALLETADE